MALAEERLGLAQLLLPWYRDHGRHELPWRQTRDDYALWLAEVLLQQTQVRTALPYYGRFLSAFPSWQDLASAPLDAVLAQWSGLGYYARARNAHRAAQMVVQEHGGRFPPTMAAAMALPGVGRSTAAAVLASAYGQDQAILDANARRVLFRAAGLVGEPRSSTNDRKLWRIAEAETPAGAAHDYNQAIQDLGAVLCRAARPDCPNCPVQSRCRAAALPKRRELPREGDRSARPRRYATLLLARDDGGRVLLQRRPERGIWGGLWSLPSLDDEQILVDSSLRAQVLERYAAAVGLVLHEQSLGPVQRHTFSHFSLEYAVLHASLRVQAVADKGSPLLCWDLAAALQLGLPSPIRRLLEQLD
ncbi:A/G-specific adenine glycosylase [Acidithiobacillus sp.]|uniref:A/G-specific adenine glycosylase n=1 Tax=Acidithiobacillus sp. TaxID=1872118 RepID=UPI0025C27E35|nr:A/G-specific adenine glycosylase [Acidithiobacillus sp.]